MKRSMYLLVSMIVLASMLLAGCGPAATVAPATAVPPVVVPTQPVAGCAAATGTAAIPFPSGGKTVTVAFSQEPDLLSGLFSSMSFAQWITQGILVGLGTWDANNNFIPELAVEVPSAANGGVSADGLTITWHLKPCLYWSDGEPLTSADVKFTW